MSGSNNPERSENQPERTPQGEAGAVSERVNHLISESVNRNLINEEQRLGPRAPTHYDGLGNSIESLNRPTTVYSRYEQLDGTHTYRFLRDGTNPFGDSAVFTIRPVERGHGTAYIVEGEGGATTTVTTTPDGGKEVRSSDSTGILTVGAGPGGELLKFVREDSSGTTLVNYDGSQRTGSALQVRGIQSRELPPNTVEQVCDLIGQVLRRVEASLGVSINMPPDLTGSSGAPDAGSRTTSELTAPEPVPAAGTGSRINLQAEVTNPGEPQQPHLPPAQPEHTQRISTRSDDPNKGSQQASINHEASRWSTRVVERFFPSDGKMSEEWNSSNIIGLRDLVSQARTNLSDQEFRQFIQSLENSTSRMNPDGSRRPLITHTEQNGRVDEIRIGNEATLRANGEATVRNGARHVRIDRNDTNIEVAQWNDRIGRQFFNEGPEHNQWTGNIDGLRESMEGAREQLNSQDFSAFARRIQEGTNGFIQARFDNSGSVSEISTGQGAEARVAFRESWRQDRSARWNDRVGDEFFRSGQFNGNEAGLRNIINQARSNLNDQEFRRFLQSIENGTSVRNSDGSRRAFISHTEQDGIVEEISIGREVPIAERNQRLIETMRSRGASEGDLSLLGNDLRQLRQRGLSDNNVSLVLDQVDRLMACQGDREVDRRVTPDERRRIAMQIINHAARPTDVFQGPHKTCQVTAMELRMFTRCPQRAAELIVTAAITGEWTAPDGRHITVDNSSFRPGTEERRLTYPDTGARTHASQIFQLVAVNNAVQRRVPPQYYRQEAPTNTRDTGERLYDERNRPVMEEAGGRRVAVQQPSLTDNEIGQLGQRLTNERSYLLTHSSMPGGDGVRSISSEAQFQDVIEASIRDQQLPLTIGVDANHPSFRGNGLPGNRGQLHAVSLTGYNPATRQLTIEDPRGYHLVIAASDVFHAMEGWPPR